jgi:hypothetical protein
MERQKGTAIKRPLMARLGSWLRGVIGKEQRADPQWDEDVKRQQAGKMGENIRLPEDIRASQR